MAEVITRGTVEKHTETTKDLKALDWISLILVVVGGLNWALVGLVNLDLVAGIFGELSIASRVVYILVGVAALYLAFAVSRFTRR